MILIAHRALTDGPNPARENHPDQIRHCLRHGYHVEVDLWFSDGAWWLGHDGPQYDFHGDLFFEKNIWFHAKNNAAAQQLILDPNLDINYFWHQHDDRVLTSKGYWWTQPGKELGLHSIAVMPESHISVENLSSCKNWQCAGVCSDYVSMMH